MIFPHANQSTLNRFHKLPIELREHILLSGSLHKAITSDVYEQLAELPPVGPLSPQEKQIHTLANSLTGENFSNLLFKSYRDWHAPLFEALMKRIHTVENNRIQNIAGAEKAILTPQGQTDTLSKLLEMDMLSDRLGVLHNRTGAYSKLMAIAQNAQIPLNENVFQKAADCGKPHKLRNMLETLAHSLNDQQKNQLQDLALAQENRVNQVSQLPVAERQEHLQRLVNSELESPETEAAKKRELLALAQTPDINLNIDEPEGVTLLQKACADDGHIDLATALSYIPEVDINLEGWFGLNGPPLHIAAANGKMEILDALLRTPGIEINQASPTLGTALNMAAMCGRRDIIRRLLKEKELNVNSLSSHGRTPLHDVVTLGITEVSAVDCVKELIQAPQTNLNQGDMYGNTPLHDAITEEAADCVKVLTEAPRINLNQTNNSGDTPLHVAVETGNMDIIKHLLNRAESINFAQANHSGDTPVLTAIDLRNTPAALAIIQAAVTHNKPISTDIRTLLRAARNQNLPQVLDALNDLPRAGG
ncbi:ankyrin repeat domain-containing protein [Vampirovibrio sp.]|uniref:ankyrin repeat domain-containing protein n=1 Tax=Vampirovibrio sp. TaxID=2717857 RepID=UPI003593CEEA